MAETRFEYLDEITRTYLRSAIFIYGKLKEFDYEIESLENGQKFTIGDEGKKFLSLLLASYVKSDKSKIREFLCAESNSNIKGILGKVLYELPLSRDNVQSTNDFFLILGTDFANVLNSPTNQFCDMNILTPESIFTMYCIKSLYDDEINPAYLLCRNEDYKNQTSENVHKLTQLFYSIYNSAKYHGEVTHKEPLAMAYIKERLTRQLEKKLTAPTSHATLQSSTPQKEEQSENIVENPESIWEKLDKIQHKFIGQERLAKELFFNIINNQYLAEQEEIADGERSLIFLDGPTGTGKTAITREITKLLNIPFTSTSITNYSSAGYVGGNLTDTLVDLYKKSGGDLKKAEKGIIVLDEFDKIVSHSLNGLEMKRAVQQQLLDFLGGGKYIISIGNRTDVKQVEFDTSKLTFVCLGALTDLRTKKTDKRFSLGFASDSTSQSKNDGTYTITPQDLIDLGLERELVGRFNTFLHTDEYDKAALERILRESTISPTKSFEKLLSSHGISLEVDDTVYGAIANSAYELNTGARSLQTVMNNIRTRYLEEIITGKSKNIHLTKDNVETIVQDTMNRRERG